MAKVVVIGLPGETGLWIADLDAGTVTPFEQPAEGDLAAVAKLRGTGAIVAKNVDFAVAVSSADAAFSGHVDG